MTRAARKQDWTRTPARLALALVLVALTGVLLLIAAPWRTGPAPHAVALTTRTLDVNTARPDELELLPRIGPELAERIVTFREEHGRFESLESLDAVPGIGPHTLEEVAPFVRFSAPGPASNR